MALSFFLLVVNYLALLITYVYRFFHPGAQSSEWLETGGTTAFFMLFLSTMGVVISVLLSTIISDPGSINSIIIISGLIYLLYHTAPLFRFIYSKFAVLLTPLDGVLFSTALLQEIIILADVSVSRPDAFYFIFMWSVLGFFAILFGSIYLGKLIERSFLGVDNRHRAFLVKNKLMLREGPSMSTAIGVLFCLWMIAKTVIYFSYGYI